MAQRNIGDAEVMEELFASFGLAMLTGVLCIFVVLVLLFNARTLMVSFQVSHGWLVACNTVRIWRNCCKAGIWTRVSGPAR